MKLVNTFWAQIGLAHTYLNTISKQINWQEINNIIYHEYVHIYIHKYKYVIEETQWNYNHSKNKKSNNNKTQYWTGGQPQWQLFKVIYIHAHTHTPLYMGVYVCTHAHIKKLISIAEYIDGLICWVTVYCSKSNCLCMDALTGATNVLLQFKFSRSAPKGPYREGTNVLKCPALQPTCTQAHRQRRLAYKSEAKR